MVFNVGLGFRQFWNGRAASLEEQIDGPLLADLEMGSRREQVLDKLKASPEYPAVLRDLPGGYHGYECS